MDNTKALTTIALQPLARYPAKDEITTLKARIRDLIPGASKFDDAVLTAFAQISLAHDLDPFIGEIWIIPTKRGPRIRAGIEGHRKLAREQSGYQIEQRLMSDEERQLHALRDNQIGTITLIYRLDTHIPGEPLRPFIGHGIYTNGDRVAATKTPYWISLKRSEQDALRKAFDIPFANGARTTKATNGDVQITPFPAVSARDRAAIEWGYSQGAFSAKTHAYNAHAKLLRLHPEATPDELDSLWTTDISRRLADIAATSLAEATEEAEPHDDWDGEVFAAGEDPPPADESQEEIIDGTATEISGEKQKEPPPAYFRTPAAAVTWAIRQGAFPGITVAQAAYATLKASGKPKTATEMASLWTEMVRYRLELQAEDDAEA